MFVTYSKTAHTNKELIQTEKDLLKLGYHLLKEEGFYRYYKNSIGITSAIYMKFKTQRSCI